MLIQTSLAFNIDTKVPIVKRWNPDSYFGYSVAQHRIKDRTGSGKDQFVILVGAPKANITDRDASEESRRIIRPGGIYQCPYTSYSDDCTRLNIDLQDTGTDTQDMWLGVSVASQGIEESQAVACAHRFKTVGPSFRWGLGICVTLTNTLDYRDPLEPCTGKVYGHEDYGFCQAGTSCAIDEDGYYLLGAPGAVTWRGTAFMNYIAKSLEDDLKWRQAPVDNPIQGMNMQQPAMANFYSYLGMSAKIGRLIGGRKTYVTGAPRAKDSGQVVMFQQVGEELLARPEHYLTGDLFGSYFGYDIALGDFNGDGNEDLVVGAPFYHGTGVGGAIYVYLNGPQGITSLSRPMKIVSRKMKEAECAQLDCQNARFGFALSSIGDVNLDDFEDLAVGAPYEGSGVVYIFHGSASGIIKEYAQRIAASEISTSPTPLSFGSSLIGGMDMDQNGYPDIAVGSFTSSEMHLLRARPVINLFTVFEAVPAMIDPKNTRCPKTGINATCFEVNIRVRFTAKPMERFSGSIALQYTLEAEKFSGTKISRVRFGRATGSDQSMISGSLQLKPQSSPEYTSSSELAYIEAGTRDFLNPIPLQLTFKLRDDRQPVMNIGDSPPNLDDFPVLHASSTKSTINVDFLKDCGTDGMCESDLNLSAKLLLSREADGTYVLHEGIDNEIILEVTIYNKEEDAHEATVTVTHPETLGFTGPDERGREYSCTPVKNVIECSIGNPLKNRQMAKFGIKMAKLNNTNLAFDASDWKKFNISVVANTTSVELNAFDNTAVMNVRVVSETDVEVRAKSFPGTVYFSGEIQGENMIKTEDQIGSEVIHTYEIKNLGRAPVKKSSRVEISWPFEVGNPSSSNVRGKHLLYLMEEPMIDGGQGSCTVDPRMINPNGYRPALLRPLGPGNESAVAVKTDESRPLRTKREALELKIDVGDRTITLDCDDRTARCFTFHCDIGELAQPGSITIKIRSRLWNSTFLEYYTDYDAVFIRSKAVVTIDPTIQQPNTANDVAWAVTTVHPSREIQKPTGVPLWVIIVGVLVGVLILVILIILLWKLGFFKRQKHDEMAQHKAKVEKNNIEDYHD